MSQIPIPSQVPASSSSSQQQQQQSSAPSSVRGATGRTSPRASASSSTARPGVTIRTATSQQSLQSSAERSITEPEEEERRCWICHGTSTEELEDPTVNTHGEWKSPCKCALVAHEGCLLEWIADLQTSQHKTGKVTCPQCKSEIKMKQKDSFVLDIVNSAIKAADASIPVFILCGLGSMVWIGCTVYGVNSVYLICGPEFANTLFLGSSTHPTDLAWSWRLALGLPSIPIVLIGSRTRYMDAILPVVPFVFFVNSDPLHLTFPPSPALTLAVLPYIRGAYNSLWDRFLAPWEKEWLKVGLPAGSTAVEERPVVEHEVLEEAGPLAGAEVAEEGARQWGGGVRVDNILINGTSLSRTIVGALLFPGVTAVMGGLLGKIPWLRGRLPSAFHRNVLGGCLFVLLKDLLRFYLTYKRAKQFRTRHVLNYERKKSKPSRTSRSSESSSRAAASGEA